MTAFHLFLEQHTKRYCFSHFQIAKNGVWEETLRIQPSPEMSEVEKFVENADQDIAIEAFFQKSKDDFLFFGIRIKALSKSEQVTFIKKFIESVCIETRFLDFIMSVRKILGASIFENPPDFLEIGAEGYWKSYGSLVVKEANGAALHIEEIEEKAPQLLKPFSRHMMLEHAYNDPMPHWLALSVSKKCFSEKQGDEFIFDTKKYEMFVKSVFKDGFTDPYF